MSNNTSNNYNSIDAGARNSRNYPENLSSSDQRILNAQKEVEESVSKFERALNHLRMEFDQSGDKFTALGEKAAEKVDGFYQAKDRATELMHEPIKLLDKYILQQKDQVESYIHDCRLGVEKYIQESISEAENYVQVKALEVKQGLSDLITDSFKETEQTTEEFVQKVEAKLDRFMVNTRQRVADTLGSVNRVGGVWGLIFLGGCLLGIQLIKRRTTARAAPMETPVELERGVDFSDVA